MACYWPIPRDHQSHPHCFWEGSLGEGHVEADCDMFQLWLEGREGIEDEERSWFVILRDLFDIG